MNKKAFLLIIVAGLMWGASGLFVKSLAPYGFSSLQMTAMRGFVSFLCMAGYVLIRNRAFFRINPRELILYVPNGVLLFATAIFYYVAMQRTSIATAVVLMYTAPVLVMIFSVLFLGEKLTFMKGGAVFIMLVGCALVSGVVGGLEFDALGIFLALMSGVCYAAYNIIGKLEMNKGCRPESATVYHFIVFSLIAVPICDPADIFVHATEPVAWLLLIGLGVVTFVVPYFLYTVAMKDMPAGTASALGIVEPMSATVYAMIAFGEIPDAFGWCGIVLVLSAVVLLGLAESAHSKVKTGDSDSEQKADNRHYP